MTVYQRVLVRVYCDGGTHQGLEFTVSGDDGRHQAKVRETIRNAGWTITRDGSTYCRDHKPKRR
jgi:hypothetical protein